MFALVLALLFCVAVGVGVVGYVLIEARREGRGRFWTPEGEELLDGARRTGAKVRERSEEFGRTAARTTKRLRPQRTTADAHPASAPEPAEDGAERKLPTAS